MDIRLKSIKNIRDFAQFGYSGFIRSAHLNGLSDEDAAVLTEKYNLKTIIDLRTSKEAEEKPDREMEGVAYLHIPIFEDAIPGISHESETDEMNAMIPDMARMYFLIATEEPYVGQIRKVMDVILDKERHGAVLWHCSEGKDRCGIISALFLLSRGVDEKSVMKDYLRTNRVNYWKASKYYLLVLLSRKNFALARQVREAFLARRKYMEPIMGMLIKVGRRSCLLP